MTKHDFIATWMSQLVSHTKRDMNAIKTKGLYATDFPRQSVRINFADGSSVFFKYAFVLTSPKHPNLVAVFTEHCGYHHFNVYEDDTLAIKAMK